MLRMAAIDRVLVITKLCQPLQNSNGYGSNLVYVCIYGRERRIERGN